MKTIVRKALACMLAVLVLFSAASVASAETAEQISFIGANMALGNELVLNFVIDAADIDDPADYTAVVTHAGKTTELPVEKHSTGNYCVSYPLAAREMADKVSAYIVNEHGDIVSETYERSIKDYAHTALDLSDGSNKAMDALMVEMLNYGAEAQKYFHYNESNLANADLTEEQQALCGDAQPCVNALVAGEQYYGTNLALNDSILLNLHFNRGDDAVEDMSAEVEFENFLGKQQTAQVEVLPYSSTLCRVRVDQIVLADARKDVTVKVYAADGSLYGEAVDSVASYVARSTGTRMDALSAAIIRFSDAAYTYLLNRGTEEDKPDVGGSASGDVVVDANGTVKESISLTDNNVQATVPAGVAVKDGTTSLTLSVDTVYDSNADVSVNENETAMSLDVHVEGVAEENTTAILVNLGEVLPIGLNMGNVALYHVENGETVEMTRVASMSELDSHNEYYYEPTTGEVTVALASFSEIVMVNEEAKWEGAVDYSWYDAAATTHTIANADQLAALSAIVGGMVGQTQDSFAGETINLIADIDLDDAEANNDESKIFYPIGYYNSEGTYEKTGTAITSGFKTFEGTFNGNGHTIANFYHNTWEMKGDHEWYAATEQCYRDGMGLFGKVYGGTVKNLTIKNFSSDGEITTTGCVAAYADFGATFENIAIFNCNPRVYNIGNGGIVGCVGWYTKAVTNKPVTFKNITVDNTNKISALWGSWDVACGGLVGQYYPTSGQDSYGNPKNGGISFENCHVSAQIDVNNDVCANYQYYAYRYAGMIIGSVRENETIDGHVYPKMDGITAKGCTVKYGDWNDYYYCELVANSLASYTHDHQFSRLVILESLDEIQAGDTWLKTGNYLLIDGETKTCYHIVKDAEGNLVRHMHEDSGEETVNGETVLKEDKQIVYLPFDQMFTGYGWGVTSKGVKDFEGITNLDIKYGDEDTSVTKFEYVGQESYITGKTLPLGNLFQTIADSGVAVDYDNVQVFVSPADDTSTVSAVYTPNKSVWGMGTLAFSGLGKAIITINDYYFCTPTTVEIEITEDNSLENPTVYTVDFKQFAKDIAAQELWNDLPYEITQEWLDAHPNADQATMRVPMSAETRYVGRFYEAKTATDKFLWGDTEKAAYDSIVEYQKANYNWYWYEPTTKLKTGENAKGMFVNYADNITWGISLYTGQLNNSNANFNFVLNVEKAGAYTLDMTAYYEGLTGAANIAATTGGGSGSGYLDILVNGKHAVDDYCLLGTYENGRINATMSNYMATVYLREGENIISLRPAKDMHGTESHHRRQINLVSMTFTEANCEHEVITDYYCETCGMQFVPESHILIDFKDFAKKASKTDWWQQLGATAIDKAKYLGYELKAMTAENKAAYTAMQQWLSENACWNFNEEVTGFTTTLDRKHVYLNASDAMTWGLAYYSTYFNCDNAKLGITVNVEKAGPYQLDMTAFYEGTTSNFNTDQVTGGTSNQPGVGGGYADIFVNGRLVADDHVFYPQNQQSVTQKSTVATIWLEEGENDITVVQALDHAGKLGSTSRRFICLKHLALVPVECAHETEIYEYARGEQMLSHVRSTVCANCFKVSAIDDGTCVDANSDYFCDNCGGPVVDTNETFMIGDENMLRTFSKLVDMGVSELNAELTDDIALTSAWVTNLTVDHTIGSAEAPYAGTFDGAGHTISGLTMSFGNVRASLGDGNNDNVRDFRLGLFSTTDGATIKDLTVEGSLKLSGRQTEYSKVAGIVACATDTTITNCVNRVTMTGNSSGSWAYQTNVGGIVGLADRCTVTRCGNEADLIVSGRYMGGLVGRIAVSDTPTVVCESYNLGTIDGCREVGGLVGVVGGCTNEETRTTITNCYSYGDFGSHSLKTVNKQTVYDYSNRYCGGLFGSADDENVYIELSNLIMSGSTFNAEMEGLTNAVVQSWPSAAFPVRENIWYEEGKGVEVSNAGGNYWGSGVSAEDLADPNFVRSLGCEFVLVDGETLPVLAWQHAHTEAAGYIHNGDMTHTEATVCEGCSWAEPVAETEACTDEDADNVCDVCEAELSCLHLRKKTRLVTADDETSHDIVVTCNSVCKQVLSTETVVCAETELITKLVSNGNVTHTTTVSCECGRVISEVTEDCADDAGTTSVVCGVCNGSLECKHPNTTASYEAVGEQKHTVTKTCDDCEAVVSVEEADCVNENGDLECDLCTGELPCEHALTTPSYAENGNQTHTVTNTCDECEEIVSTETVGCADEDGDYYCDACGGQVVPEGTYFIDFKYSAKKASEQPFWQNLRTVSGDAGSSKFIGIRGWGREETGAIKMTETEIEAYGEMLTYMKQNFGWTINEETTPLNLETNSVPNKAVLFNTDGAVKWGLSYLSGGFDTEDHVSKLDLTVTVEEAGWYAIDLTAFHEANYGSTTMGSYAGLYSGSGYAEILVNGNSLLEEYCFCGGLDGVSNTINGQEMANRVAAVEVGYAYLNAGENTITINTTKDLNGETTSLAHAICLQSMKLELVSTDECPVCQGTDETCAVCATKPEDSVVDPEG
ncbi:MAG: hypothetical protein J6J43_00140 [Oscillospiraceae bacterium]|nr:hypothetical protein [Oscillospiraceae bacterium]